MAALARALLAWDSTELALDIWLWEPEAEGMLAPAEGMLTLGREAWATWVELDCPPEELDGLELDADWLDELDALELELELELDADWELLDELCCDEGLDCCDDELDSLEEL